MIGEVYYLEDRYAAVQFPYASGFCVLTSTQDSEVFPSDILLCAEATVGKYNIYMKGLLITMNHRSGLLKIGSIPNKYRQFFSNRCYREWHRPDSEWLYLCEQYGDDIW